MQRVCGRARRQQHKHRHQPQPLALLSGVLSAPAPGCCLLTVCLEISCANKKEISLPPWQIWVSKRAGLDTTAVCVAVACSGKPARKGGLYHRNPFFPGSSVHYRNTQEPSSKVTSLRERHCRAFLQHFAISVLAVVAAVSPVGPTIATSTQNCTNVIPVNI